jgi:uncharacterized protein (DUF983 family)
MKRTLDILIVLIVVVGIAVIIGLAANRPIYEQIPLAASWLVMIAVGAVCEIVDVIIDRNAERKGSRASQIHPLGYAGVNAEGSSPGVAA